MKTLITTLLLVSLNATAQIFGPPNIPDDIQEYMQKHATYLEPIEKVYYGNHVYVFKVKGDTNLVHWDLIERKRLWVDHWKTAGTVYFFTTWAGGFFILPALHLEKDKYYHALFGGATGVGLNYLVYKWTGNKWIACLAGSIAPWVIGLGKEGYDKISGNGVYSGSDILATGIPGTYLSIGTTIVIGNKNKKRHHKDIMNLNRYSKTEQFTP